MDPLQLTIDLCSIITPMKFHTLKGAHIPMADGWQMADLCYTITPNKFHIEKNSHIPMADGQPPIKYGSMQHHYTQYVSDIEEFTYTYGIWIPSNGA